MQALGITGQMYKLVPTFLDSRRMAMKVGDSKSKSHTLDMGVPQGSVVAPTLFNITLHGIQRVGRPGLGISLYADDLWTVQPTRSSDAIDHNQTYMKYNHFELFAEKTVLVVFTRNTQSCRDLLVRIGGKVAANMQSFWVSQLPSAWPGCLKSWASLPRPDGHPLWSNSLKGKHGLHPEAWHTWLTL